MRLEIRQKCFLSGDAIEPLNNESFLNLEKNTRFAQKMTKMTVSKVKRNQFSSLHQHEIVFHYKKKLNHFRKMKNCQNTNEALYQREVSFCHTIQPVAPSVCKIFILFDVRFHIIVSLLFTQTQQRVRMEATRHAPERGHCLEIISRWKRS